jgi:hypothetical protein
MQDEFDADVSEGPPPAMRMLLEGTMQHIPFTPPVEEKRKTEQPNRPERLPSKEPQDVPAAPNNQLTRLYLELMGTPRKKSRPGAHENKDFPQVQPLQTPALAIFCPCASVDPVVAATSSCLPQQSTEHKLKTKECDLPACNHLKAEI